MKQKNAVLRKKLRLLKRAYEELKTENAQLKEQLDPSNTQGESTDGENVESDSIERTPSSGKIKRSSGVRPSKDRPSSRKLKVTDGSSSAKEE